MALVKTGLDILAKSKSFQASLNGNVGYLCNSASVDATITHGILILKKLFNKRFTKVFTPQHGLFADVQDNMLESPHYDDPNLGVKIYSLYSETRSPKPEWLDGLDHLIVDLQDVGTRVYTFIYTVALTMNACAKRGVKVTILDRPNPINGLSVEGNLQEDKYKSFVGMYNLPMRHGLTMGEFATYLNHFHGIDCEVEVIKLDNWQRSMYFDETGLPWVMPSPNLPSMDTAMVYPGMVLFEGTNLSEGRGTARPFEFIGHPEIEPFGLLKELDSVFSETGLRGFKLRPLVYQPTFHKFHEIICGGYQIHITNRQLFKPWHFSQVFMREMSRYLGNNFEWLQPPYEYEYKLPPIDILNGTDKIRLWIEEQDSYDKLINIEAEEMSSFLNKRDNILLYS